MLLDKTFKRISRIVSLFIYRIRYTRDHIDKANIVALIYVNYFIYVQKILITQNVLKNSPNKIRLILKYLFLR